MPQLPDKPDLRLVHTTEATTTPAAAPTTTPEQTPALLRSGLQRAARQVYAENRAAANPDIDPTDPRWVFAARTLSQLDGSALPPRRRDSLMKTARQLGIRPFDASVIMALVQDRARRGSSLHDITTTLTMMPLQKKGDGSLFLWRWMAAVLCAAGAAALLIQWVLAGG